MRDDKQQEEKQKEESKEKENRLQFLNVLVCLKLAPAGFTFTVCNTGADGCWATGVSSMVDSLSKPHNPYLQKRRPSTEPQLRPTSQSAHTHTHTLAGASWAESTRDVCSEGLSRLLEVWPADNAAWLFAQMTAVEAVHPVKPLPIMQDQPATGRLHVQTHEQPRDPKIGLLQAPFQATKQRRPRTPSIQSTRNTKQEKNPNEKHKQSRNPNRKSEIQSTT